MDQMIDQVKLCAKNEQKSYTDEQLQSIASYLMGQTPWDVVAPMLHQSKRTYYYGPYQQFEAAIADACGEQPALLPRLGRHLKLVRHINKRLYDQSLQRYCTALSPQAVFLTAGLGPEAMLDFIFADNGYGVRGDIRALVDILDTEYPGETENYISIKSPLAAIRPAACLCAKRGVDILSGKKGLEEAFTTLFITLMSTTVDRWGKASYERFFENVAKALPEAVPYLEQAKKKHGSADATNYLFYAIVLTDFKLPKVNTLLKAACEADYRHFMENLYWAVYQENRSDFNLGNNNRYYARNQDKKFVLENIPQQAKRLEELLGKIGIDVAYFCAWAMEKSLVLTGAVSDAFALLYEGDIPLLERAASIAEPMAAAGLLRMAYSTTNSLSPKAPEAAVNTLRKSARGTAKEADIEAVCQWLLTGEGDMAALPDLNAFYSITARYYQPTSPHCDPDIAMMALAGAHPIAGRYLSYLSSLKLPRRLEWCCEFLLEYLGMSAEESAAYIAGQVDTGSAIYSLASSSSVNESAVPNALVQIFRGLVSMYPEKAAAAMKDKAADAATRLCLLDTIYLVKPDYDSAFLISCLQDKSKKVRQYAVSFLLPKKELIEEIRPLLEAKKKDLREAAEQLMSAYEGASGLSAGGDTDVVSLCTRTMPKSGTAAIRWAFPGDIPQVRWKESGEKADDIVTNCYLVLLLGAKAIQLPPAAAKIREALNEDDLRDIASQVFQQWISDGSPTKQRGALLMFGCHANDADVLTLTKQIDDWASHSRGAIASEAVHALALGGSDLALMTVDNIGRKFKNKQVRRAGQEAFAAAAAVLGTTPDALGDRIIPTLGFDERGEKVVDYGTRKFTAILSPSLAMELQDETGKTIKALPKPGAKDDVEKAEKAKAEFTALKKSLKTVVTTQTQRLEQALATGRRWSKGAWEKLFVRNPIMHSFAIGLIWGTYQGDALKETFRYMEDGSFTTVEEDEFDFASVTSGEIGLVHPLDMTEDLVAQWKEQLDDYDITQPVLQLGRAVYHLEDAEKSAIGLDRFGGKQLVGITLMNKLQKSGWYKGSVQDAGVFYTFYKEIGEIGMQLYFSGMYVSPDPTEAITVGQAGFYKAGSVNRGSYVYDDVKKEDAIPLAEVPPRMFSELVLDLANATATSSEFNKAWKSEGGLLFFDGK